MDERRVKPPSSLEEHVYELIKQDILSGRLAPGTQLVEARLAEEFGVSKTPVREALIRLRLDGLLDIERFRGARVIRPSLTDVQEIFQLRRWIEGGIAVSIAEQRPKEILGQLRTNIHSTRQALREGREDDYLAAIREFDHILAAGTGNTRAARILLDLYNIFAVIGAATLLAPGRRERSITEHQRIYEAVSAGDLSGAVAATIKHIDSIERDYEDWIPPEETEFRQVAGR
ncbi:MAG TPA: GntR family transcriptional regulator [Actinomycetota bacterium]|jgi:DNA-binding GntR family transcriptional regulator|nr:GntR family transcriptional regulator [Actinomycetota bacterium]